MSMQGMQLAFGQYKRSHWRNGLCIVAGQSNALNAAAYVATLNWVPAADVATVALGGAAMHPSWESGDASGLRAALASAITPGREYVTVLWAQGESDAEAFRTTAQYAADFAQLKAAVESGRTDVLWCIALLSPYNGVDVSQILAAQQQCIATLPRCIGFATDSYTRVGGGAHFDAAGLTQLWSDALAKIDGYNESFAR